MPTVGRTCNPLTESVHAAVEGAVIGIVTVVAVVTTAPTTMPRQPTPPAEAEADPGLNSKPAGRFSTRLPMGRSPAPPSWMAGPMSVV